MVIEIAARRQTRPGLCKDLRRHLLRGGLAIAAGNADHRDREGCTPALRGLLQRYLRIIDHDLRKTQALLRVDHRARSARSLGLPQEISGVEARSMQCDEQLARAQRPRIGGNTLI